MTSMTLPAFNPLKFAARLKEVGVSDQQAEVEAEMLHEALTQQAQIVSALENKVTALKDSTKRDAEQMATKGDIALLDAKMSLLRKDIALARRDTIIWLGGMLIAGFGTVLAVLPRLLG